jgi:hypothetical protein
MAPVPGHVPSVEPVSATAAGNVPPDEENWTGQAKWDGARILRCPSHAYTSWCIAENYGPSGEAGPPAPLEYALGTGSWL